jgi:uncharacterized protein YndB with AHSA1/START domain
MTDYGTFIAPDTVRFQRVLPGPIERVWDFLTKSEHLPTWLGEGEIESRVGSRIELRSIGDEDRPGRVVRGEVKEYEPPRLLKYSWIVEIPDKGSLESVVTFALAPQGEQVLLILTHQGVLPDFRALTLAGWHGLLDSLGKSLGGQAPGPFGQAFERVLPEYHRQVGGLDKPPI